MWEIFNCDFLAVTLNLLNSKPLPMKRIFTLILALTTLTTAFGQSIKILKGTTDVTNTVITLSINKDENLETFLSLKNTTANTINFQVNRSILNGPMVDDSCASLYYCTGSLCYPPKSEINWTPDPNPDALIGPNETLADVKGITAHYWTCEDHCRDLTVMYRVYNEAPGSKDTAKLTIKYTCSTGIDEEVAASAFISNAYPNPASTDFSVNYHMNSFAKSEITITDVLGKKIKEVKLTEKEGNITISTSQLKEGIYFYSLIVNNHVTATRKIVIRN
jgi:hypothetical protein